MADGELHEISKAIGGLESAMESQQRQQANVFDRLAAVERESAAQTAILARLEKVIETMPATVERVSDQMRHAVADVAAELKKHSAQDDTRFARFDRLWNRMSAVGKAAAWVLSFLGLGGLVAAIRSLSGGNGG